MNSKKWTIKLILSIILSIFLVFIINFIIDPLWIFGHSNFLNKKQEGFDERKLKTIYLKNHTNFNTLLLGSSRTTFYNQNHFSNNMKVFNYSFSNAKPYEYLDYINYFKENNNLQNLILGFDFFASTLESDEDRNKRISRNKEQISEIKKLNSYEYFFKYAFTLDVLKHSLENIKRSILDTNDKRSYNRQNVANCDLINKDKVIKTSQKRATTYYSKVLEFDESLVNTLNQIKFSNPNTKIIIYTTPLSKPFLDKIKNNKKLKKIYYKWINTLVNNFDKIYFTTYYNDFSNNYSIFSRDGDHYYSHIVKEISKFIGKKEINKQFINSENILILDKNNVNSIKGKLL